MKYLIGVIFILSILIASAQATEINLNSGWNFISTPSTLASGNDSAFIFHEVDTGGHSIYAYNASAKAWHQLMSDDIIQPLDAFWIYSVSPTSVPLVFDTNSLTPSSKQLEPGWNAIGFSDTLPAAAHETLVSVDASWTTAIGFDAQTQQYETSILHGGTGNQMDK